METKRKRTRTAVSVLVLTGLLVFSLLAVTGDYDLYSSAAQAGSAVVNSPEISTGMYIDFEGVEGESQDADHRGWSDILSFSQGQFLPDVGMGPARQREDVFFEDMVVTRELDKASPKLAEAVAKGQVYPRVEIHLTRSRTGVGPVTYYAYELRNVVISSYHIAGSGSSEQSPIEEVTLNFEEIKVTYAEFDAAGKMKGTVEYTWNVMASAP